MPLRRTVIFESLSLPTSCNSAASRLEPQIQLQGIFQSQVQFYGLRTFVSKNPTKNGRWRSSVWQIMPEVNASTLSLGLPAQGRRSLSSRAHLLVCVLNASAMAKTASSHSLDVSIVNQRVSSAKPPKLIEMSTASTRRYLQPTARKLIFYPVQERKILLLSLL